MTIKLALQNALLALRQIHVRGEDARMLSGAMENIEASIRTIERLEKEGENNANNHDQQREGV